jgi:hypothetical protein
MEGAHQATASQISITKSERGNTKLFATMLAVIQKFNQVSSLQGQLIAAQDRPLRAERRSDELEDPTAMPNRQVQQLSQESAAHAAAAIPPITIRDPRK